MRKILFLTILVFLASLPIVSAGLDTYVGFPGSVQDVNTNESIPSANITLNISTQNSCTAGVIYNESFVNGVADGVFSVLLGVTTGLNLDYNRDYYSCINIDNGSHSETFGPDIFRGGQGLIAPEDINDTADYTIGRLQINGTSDTEQLIVRADATQTLTNPLIQLQDSAGSALMGITSDNQLNTYIGKEAGISSAGKTGNTYIGYRAGYQAKGIQNVFIGSYAGNAKSNAVPQYTVVIGYLAGGQMTNTDYSVLIGNRAGYNVVGDYNFFVGNQAGQTTTTGHNNVFFGANTGFRNVLGGNNIFIGTSSGYGTTGQSPWYNIGIGVQSLTKIGTGQTNVAIGHQSGYNLVSGGGNVLLGYQSGYSETGSNKLYIENSNTATPLIYGEFDNDLVKIHGDLNVTQALYFDSLHSNTGGEIVDITGDLAMDNLEAGDFDTSHLGFLGLVCHDNTTAPIATCDNVCSSHGLACTSVFDLAGDLGASPACNSACGDGAGDPYDVLCYCE